MDTNPCPFCGCSEHNLKRDENSCCVECADCMCRGPMTSYTLFGTKEAAENYTIRSWNDREYVKSLEEMMVA
jgi:hypothetical protein